jgi:EmrB/QacA subfamily drug resistance transporter
MSTDRRRWVALAVLAAAQFIVILDGAVVNVALPSIQRDLHFSGSSIQWVFSSYLLTYGGLLLLGGRVADIVGRRLMFMVGAGVLSAASLGAGLSGSAAQLLAARAAMGVGAAVITPAALSMLLGLFSEGSERNRALGLWGALIGLGAAVGVLAGGVITDGPGWQWVFFINIPIGVAVVLVAPAVLPESRAEASRVFDVAGGLTITASLVILVYAIVRGPDVGWGTARTVGLVAVGAVLLVAFVAIEVRARQPLVRLGIFRVATVAGANAVAFMFTGGFSATIFLLTLFMQRALGYSPLKTGLAYLPLTGGILVSSTIAARLVTRCGVRLVMLAGMAVTSAGLLILSQATSHSSFTGTLLPAFVLIAAGMGATAVPLSIAAFAGVADSDYGVASGLLNTSQQIGGAFGVAILSTVAYTHLRAHPAAGAAGVSSALGSADAAAFGAALLFVGGAFLLAVGAIRHSEVSVWQCATPYRTSTPRHFRSWRLPIPHLEPASAVVAAAEPIPMAGSGPIERCHEPPD